MSCLAAWTRNRPPHRIWQREISRNLQRKKFLEMNRKVSKAPASHMALTGKAMLPGKHSRNRQLHRKQTAPLQRPDAPPAERKKKQGCRRTWMPHLATCLIPWRPMLIPIRAGWPMIPQPERRKPFPRKKQNPLNRDRKIRLSPLLKTQLELQFRLWHSPPAVPLPKAGRMRRQYWHWRCAGKWRRKNPAGMPSGMRSTMPTVPGASLPGSLAGLSRRTTARPSPL